MRNLFIVAVLFISISILAQNNDEFFIGAYSHYIHLADSILLLPREEVADDIAEFLENANFNHVQACEHPEIFQNHNIIPIVYDYRVKQPPLYNDCNYQAEYITGGLPSVNLPPEWPPEMKWYQMTNEVGLSLNNDNTEDTSVQSWNYLELDTNNPAGLVVDHYINPFPWDGDEELYIQIYKSVSYFILEYAMRVNEEDFSSYPSLSTEICKIGAKVLYKETDGDNKEYKFIPIQPFDDDPNNYTVDGNYQCIDREDWEYQHQICDEQEFVKFRFKVSYSQFNDIHYGWEPFVDHWGRQINLCPVVYYSSNGPLDIDYVGVTDNKMEQLYDDDSNMVENILLACDDYASSGITKFAGRDEPFAPSFPAHKRVRELLTEKGASLYQSVCSSNFWDAYRNNADYHLINNAFNTLGKPSQIMPQFYPASPLCPVSS